MLAILLLSLVASCAMAEECVFGQWGPWSEWHAADLCGPSPDVSTWHMLPETWDTGRLAMSVSMEMKEQMLREIEECRILGTCPAYTPRPSNGPASCVDGMALDIPCRNVDMFSFLNVPDLGYGVPNEDDEKHSVSDCWGWEDPLNGDEYGIVGLSGGTSFVRITDPFNPVTVGFIYTETTSTIWRDIKTIGNYAYIGAEGLGHGIQVFDMRRLRGLHTLKYFTPDTVYKGIGNSHNVVANPETNTIYAVGCTKGAEYVNKCNGGLHAIDVSDPLNPTFAGCYGEDGYTHDAQCIIYRGPDATYYGKEVCFAFNENSLTIVDATHKHMMTMISKKAYAGVRYSHQGWVTADQTTLLLDDELDEVNEPNELEKYTKTYVWDITDLDNPVLKNVHRSAQTSIDHNQYIKGQFTYQANYMAGLRILHINQEQHTLREVGYFDVLPDATEAQFAGAWSVYPYFTSGNLIISVFEHGMFVMRPDYLSLEVEAAAPMVYEEQTRYRQLLRGPNTVQCPTTIETRGRPASPQC